MSTLDTRPGSSPEAATRRVSGTARLTALHLLVAANTVSMTGNVLLTVVVPWLVLTTTGSPALAGAVVFAGVVSATVGGLGAGRVVEALGPVRASSVADVLSGLAVAPLPILLAVDSLQIWHVVLLTALGTLTDAAGSAARQSLVPAAADGGGHRRERANALYASAEHLGYLLGAPAAGLLIAGFGVGPALWVAVAAFGFAAVAMRGLGSLGPRRDAAAAVAAAGLRETIAFIWGDRALRALVVFPTAAVLLVGPLAPLVLPVLARSVFHDPVVLGVMVACYGVGGLLGAAGYGVVGHAIPRRVLYLGIFLVWPSAYAAILLVAVLPVTLVMLVALGAAAGSLVPLQATIRQERSPARLLPRVIGLSTATIPVAVPTSALLTGFLIEGLGLDRASWVLVAGAALIGCFVVMSRSTRHLEG
ncbi:putative Major facilitator superfamily MFS_1 [metagenome]|uniref:Multidrug efflux pump Tap n=1 Tax=metagenome TaxID=256318 RepID=A0A2P2BZL4_9ZZZZ